MDNQVKGLSVRELIRFYLIDCETVTGKLIDVFLIGLNLLICSLFVLESYFPGQAPLFNSIDSIVVSLFIFEFILRLYASRSRLKHLFKPSTILDAVTILPTLFRWFSPTYSTSFFILLRLFRLLRIFRFMRYLADERFFFGKISPELLQVLRLLTTFIILFFISAGLFYSLESGANPKVGSYGDALYYTVITLTTVGFGDIVPVTSSGRMVTTIMVLSGIIFIPWQAGQIVRNWWKIGRKRRSKCSQCGLLYHDEDASHCKHCGGVVYQETDGNLG